MALWQEYRFGSSGQMINFLNGAIIGVENLASGADVDGLTFIADVGAGDVTVTFTAAKGRPWTAKEIADKINASIAGLARVYSHNTPTHQLRGVDQRILLVRDGTLVVKSTGTANALLGFSTTSNTTMDPVVDTEVHAIEFQHTGPTNLWLVVLYR